MTGRPSENPQAPPTVRLDVWLWATRFFKTRALAKKAIEAGHVRVEDNAARAATPVRGAQRVRVERGDDVFIVDVLELPVRRGSASVARACYRETAESIAARQSAAELRRMQRDGYERPPTKPDKRARRLIRALGDIDAL